MQGRLFYFIIVISTIYSLDDINVTVSLFLWQSDQYYRSTIIIAIGPPWVTLDGMMYV